MIIQDGLEMFDGCLDVNHDGRCDRDGKFGAEYIYWATFNPKSGRLIKGECIHPITGGAGAFRGLRGFVNVQDKPVGKSGVVSTYEGDLVLNAEPNEKPTLPKVSATAGPSASEVATC